MATGIAKAKARRRSHHSGYRKVQNIRTWGNVQKRRQRHRLQSPNEKESMTRAKRWVTMPH
jgi:hypothetical protein